MPTTYLYGTSATVEVYSSQHLSRTEGSHASDQQQQKVDADEFAVFVPNTDQPGTQMQEAQLRPNYYLIHQLL